MYVHSFFMHQVHVVLLVHIIKYKCCINFLQVCTRTDYVELRITNYDVRFKAAKVTDRRVKVMNEIISGIRVIKMYGWEYAFSQLVSKIRRYT